MYVFNPDSFKQTIIGLNLDSLHSLEDQLESTEVALDLTTEVGQDRQRLCRLKGDMVRTEIATRKLSVRRS